VLDAITPLGHTAPEIVTLGTITITERVDVALASLAVRRGRGADVAAAAAVAGIPLPPPGHHASQTLAAFWLTPEMWMIEAPFASHEDIRAILLAHFGDAASITEQTDAWVRFDVSGAGLAALMERLSNLDFPAAPLGMASRSVIDHLGCYVIKHGPTEVVLYGPRASAGSLHHALVETALSIA
jgi:sarcosine oxidase subunit gamma